MASSNNWFIFVKKILKNLAITLPPTIVFLDSVGYVAKVEGTSMQPSLNPSDRKSNDYVLLNKWAVRDFDIRHGDIVALICPRDPEQKIIKRVIAKEGETIKAANKLRYVAVPSGHCWVEGDHLAYSMDSNFFGPVPVGLVSAKASHIVWPPSRWRRLESALPPNRGPLKWPNAVLPLWNTEGDEED